MTEIDQVDEVPVPDHSSPVQDVERFTSAAMRKALAALQLDKIDGLESVAIFPETDEIAVNTRNSDGTSTSRVIPIK